MVTKEKNTDNKSHILWQLMIVFLKIGSIAFGGGYTITALLQRETVEHNAWVSEDEFLEMIAIAQTLPGVLYINVATIIGYHIARLRGALVATIASVLPTFLLAGVIVVFFWDKTDNIFIQKAVHGILCGVSALILHSITTMFKKSVRGTFELLLVIIAIIALLVFGVNTAIVVISIGTLNFFYRISTIVKNPSLSKTIKNQ